MVILNFLAAPRAARTGHARDQGEQEKRGEAFQKTDTYANLALYENFHILHFQKRIVSTETICGHTVLGNVLVSICKTVYSSPCNNFHTLIQPTFLEEQECQVT